jgi:hypothetical protein
MANGKKAKSPRLIRTAEQCERAFQMLRKSILTGEFKEGDPVREPRLARECKIRRTPFRQAVRQAAVFGCLTLRPKQAPSFRRLSAEDTENSIDLGAMNSTHDPSPRIAMAVDGLKCGFNYSDPLSRKGKLNSPHFECRHFAREFSCTVC